MSVRLPKRFLAAAAMLGTLLSTAALSTTVLASTPALAAPGQSGQPSRALAGAPVVSIAITSVNPPFAGPGAKVTVSGTVTNATAAAMAGLSVQLWSSNTRLATRPDMDSYLTARGAQVDAPTGTVVSLATVPPHATRTWSLTLQASQVGMTAFGVYPLAAQLTQNGTQLGAARTFLPFWPGKSELRTLKPVNIAWIWPLIDVPHRAACPALLNDTLAASLAARGRLGQLLAAGLSAAGQQAQLTWAIDPALLSDVYAMTGRYPVGGTDTCRHAVIKPASTAARSWLKEVRALTAQQDFFVTPYDDADIAALAHQGLNNELTNAFLDGQAQAGKILQGRSQRPAPGSGNSGGMGLIAWPADGIADYTVLESLGANQVGTVILGSTVMPPSPTATSTPSTVTTTPDGLGPQLNVLLADTTIDHILSMPAGSIPDSAPPTGGSPSPAADAFAREQWFLAETAMIAAGAPASAHALIVAPPRRWDPGAGILNALLAETVSTPWLHPASLASLVSTRPSPGQVHRQPPPSERVNRAELSSSLLRQIRQVNSQIKLLGLILVQPGPRYLSTAIDAVESSAWRGGRAGRRSAEQLLHSVRSYVTALQSRVRIVDTVRVTLGGKSGAVPVSISNHLPQAIRVELHVGVPSTGRVVTGNFMSKVTVDAGTQKLIKIPVRAAAAGSTTLTLWLTTLGGRPLPGTTTHLTVEATHFGTLAIVIIGVALAVFVITAAARAIRRGGEPDEDEEDDTGDSGEDDPTGLDPAYATAEADTVGRERADESPAAKEPDEHASTQGGADRR